MQAALLTGLVLLAAQRFPLPFGSLLFTLNTTLLAFLNDQLVLIPAAALAGLSADLLVGRLRLFDTDSTVRVSVFAFAMPAVLYAAYFAALALTDGIGWSVHLWAGSIALAGISGWLLSYLRIVKAYAGRATPHGSVSS